MKNTTQEKKMTLEKWITWTSVCRRRNKKKEIQIKTCFEQKN